jgi:hypothetical protein
MSIEETPFVFGPVEELPPVQRERGVSIYDPVIVAATEHPSEWIQCERGNRTVSAFKSAVLLRAAQLDLEVITVKQRGQMMYVKYDGPGQDVAAMIEQVRAESRAHYGE